MIGERHPLARCCWCGQAFVRGRVVDAEVWLCPTEACWQRQVQHAIIVTLKGKQRHCVYVPLPRQVDFFEAQEKYVLFGGAAGGSKSHALRWLAYRECLRVPNFRALILRRTYKELERSHLAEIEKDAAALGAQAVPSAKILRFPNGSVVEFGHCETAADAANYLSAEYDLIEPDELVTFEQVPFLLISSRARTTKPQVFPTVRSGTNPGGPQSHWVRQRFIDHTVDAEEYPDYRPEEWRFIESKLEDNPYLNQDYERSLMNLPPELRKAYRDGNWDIFPGQYFPEFQKKTHVADLAIPSAARWYLGVDGGFIKPAAFLWIALLPEGRAYIRHEWTPTRTLNSDQAKGVLKLSKEWGCPRFSLSVADTSLWVPEKDTGESAAETFARHGLPLVQATKDRVNGWKRLREWFALAPDGKPWLMVHPDCTYTIRTIPSLVSDETHPEDVDTDGEDHAADALRYFVMARPAPGKSSKQTKARHGTLAWWKQGESQPAGLLGRRSA